MTAPARSSAGGSSARPASRPPARLHRSAEPFLWLLFSSGGVAVALLVPVLLFLFGVAFPLGWIPAPGHDHLLAVLQHPLTRLVVFGLCVLALFHWAHRFRYTLFDGLQLKGGLRTVINVVCYGGVLAGSAVAGYLVFAA